MQNKFSPPNDYAYINEKTQLVSFFYSFGYYLVRFVFGKRHKLLKQTNYPEWQPHLKSLGVPDF